MEDALGSPKSTVVGKHVITVEGLGTVSNAHPLQERLAKLHGSQYAHPDAGRMTLTLTCYLDVGSVPLA